MSLLYAFQNQYFSHNGYSERICLNFIMEILDDRNVIFQSIRPSPVGSSEAQFS